MIHPGDGSAGRVYCPRPSQAGATPEPDVAVGEPTDRAALPSDRKSFGENEIAFFDTNQATVSGEDSFGVQLVATGFPVHFETFAPGLQLGELGTRGDIAANLVSMASAPFRLPRAEESMVISSIADNHAMASQVSHREDPRWFGGTLIDLDVVRSGPHWR